MKKEIRIGDLLEKRYRIKDILGQGAMGRVYHAHDEKVGLDVALKMIPPEISINRFEMDNMKQNFKLVQQLNHPNIAALKHLEEIEETGEYFIVMEYVPGVNLTEYRRNRTGRKIELNRAVHIAGKIASGLDYAHKLRVIHRDIKPENIMITPKGDVKILDFGLAMQIKTTVTRLTNTPYFKTSGTRPYMAPEQWLGQKQDEATDIYALGTVFYEMAAGYKPFESADFKILMHLVLNQPPKPVPGVPKNINKVLLKALAKERRARHATAGEFTDALNKCLRNQNRRFPVIAALVMLAVFVLGAVYYFHWLDRDRTREAKQFYQKIKALTPEQMLGESAADPYEKGVAEASRNVLTTLAMKNLLIGRKLALSGFGEAFSGNGCVDQGHDLKNTVLDAIFDIERKIEGDYSFAPRGNFEALENEMIMSGRNKVKVDMDVLKSVGEPDILITAGCQNHQKDFALTLTAYEKSAETADEQGPGSDTEEGAGKRYNIFTIVTSDRVKIPKAGLSPELISCLENKKIPVPTTVVGQKNPEDSGNGQQPAPKSIEPGTLVLSSIPTGAQVFLDGEKSGQTPLTLEKITPGPHRIRITHPDYEPWEKEITIEPGGNPDLNARMTQGAGNLKILSTPENASILIDGKPRDGKTPLVIENLPAGPVKVTVEMADFETKSQETHVPMNDMETVSFKMNRTRSRLYVETDPQNARVRIMNITDPFSQGIPLGVGEKYMIEVSASNYQTENREVLLSDDPENRISVKLEKGPLPGQITETVHGMKFAYIPPTPKEGFMMGSPTDEPERDNDETRHRVRLSEGFYMQTTEVTQGQWEAVMGSNPSYFKECGKECPVENVSWEDAQKFIEKLNSQGGEYTYRLPTEAEWEWAARAGTTTPFSFGRCLSTGQANYNGNYPLEGCPKGEYRGKTVSAASFQPNAWGLYNMHGNVWEWCQDWHGEYPKGEVVDPKGPDTGSARVLRGGSWGNYARYCRSAIRGRAEPSARGASVGFRLVRLPGH